MDEIVLVDLYLLGSDVGPLSSQRSEETSYPFINVGWLGRGFMRCESVDTFWALMPILAQGPTFWFFAFVGPWHFGLLIGLPGRVRRSCGSPPIRGSIIGRSRASSGWRPSSCARPLRWRPRLPIARTEAWEPCLAIGAACGRTAGAKLASGLRRLSALCAMPRRRSATPVSVPESPGEAPERRMKRRRRRKRRSSRSPGSMMQRESSRPLTPRSGSPSGRSSRPMASRTRPPSPAVPPRTAKEVTAGMAPEVVDILLDLPLPLLARLGAEGVETAADVVGLYPNVDLFMDALHAVMGNTCGC